MFTGNDVTSYFRSAANETCSFWVKFGLRFLDNLKKFTVLEPVIQVLHLLLCNLLDDPENGGSGGRAVVYALSSWLISVLSFYTSMHYING